ncbi:MAG: polar amino acid transport system permease protein [Verrucomicrobiales bacterium]|jgi:polar amino acid transport system permease protein
MPRVLREILIALGLAVVLTTVVWLVLNSAVYKSRWDEVWARRTVLFGSWLTTVGISLAALVLTIVVSILLVAGQRAGSVVLKRSCQVYVEFVRGTPLLVQLYLFFFVVAPAIGLHNGHVAGAIVLAAFSAAYLAEIIRGGIESIPEAQREAARAVGFTTAQAYRFVIIPQTIRRILPATAGEFANLIKNSSLLSVVAVSELTKEIRDAANITYVAFEFYIPLAVAYLILTVPIALGARWLESKFAYAT